MEGTTAPNISFDDIFTNITPASYAGLKHPYWSQFDLDKIVTPAHHYAIAMWMTVFGISGTLGNAVVIYTFIRVKSLRTAPNFLIVNLGLSDMTFCAVNGFPIFTIASINMKWVWGKLCCELYAFIGGITGLASINSLVWISLDRFYCITQPLNAAQKLTKKRSFVAVAIVWLWASCWSIPPLFGWGRYVQEAFQTSCTFDYLSHDISNATFVLGMYVFGFSIPVFIIFYCYVGIIKGMINHHKEMAATAARMGAKVDQAKLDSERNSEIALAKIAGMTISAFLMSWSPYAIVAALGMVNPHSAKAVHPYFAELTVLLAKASASWNPVIYAVSHPKFRAEIEKQFPFLLLFCPVKPDKGAAAKSNLKKDDTAMSIKSIASEAPTETMEMSMGDATPTV